VVSPTEPAIYRTGKEGVSKLETEMGNELWSGRLTGINRVAISRDGQSLIGVQVANAPMGYAISFDRDGNMGWERKRSAGAVGLPDMAIVPAASLVVEPVAAAGQLSVYDLATGEPLTRRR
jgi:hypothetical protein